MTISQSLIIVLLISIWAGIAGADLATNSNILIILLIALIALAVSTNFNCNLSNLITTNPTTITQTII